MKLSGVHFRSMSTALHGILLYTEQADAKEAYGILKAVESGEEGAELLVQECYQKSYSEVESIHYKDVQEKMNDVGFQVNHNGWVSPEVADIKLINYGQCVDLY